MHSVNFDQVIATAIAIPPAAARSASTNGTAVDCARTGPNGQRVKSVSFVLTTGVVTDGSYTLSVEESDASGSGYAAIDSNRVSSPDTAIADTDDNAVFVVHCAPTKRYCRLVVTAAGTTTGAIYGASAILFAD